MAPARPPQFTPDTAAWRLAFYLTTTAFDGGREKFVRLLILLIISTAAVSVLVLLLGPYPTAGLGIGTLASRTYARRAQR
ncbi:hypothetical protein ACFYV7_39080 [Nocardia suismassiliense]|uniref:Uncharacterized protein n=1 Tax=Nocardia suismassiliense TaxID=2077092 RepID=A0ABW6R5R2_9NOCA